jgi:hypothetical protein
LDKYQQQQGSNFYFAWKTWEKHTQYAHTKQ